MEIGTNQSQCLQDIPLEPMDIQDFDLGCKPSRSSEECVHGNFKHASRMEICQPSTKERAKSTSPRIHGSHKEIATSPNTDNSGAEVAASCSLEMELNPGIKECPEDIFETAETAAGNEETKESNICTQSNMPEASGEEIQPTEAATRIKVVDEDLTMAEAARATIACKCMKTEITITMANEEIQPTECAGIKVADEDLTMSILCKHGKTEATKTMADVEIQPTEATKNKIADEDSTMAESARAKRRKTIVLEEGRRLTRSSMKG